MTDLVMVEVSDGICTLTLNRPEARNALSAGLLAAWTDAMCVAEGDPDVSVVVLTGADPAFCAGMDLKELGAGGDNFDLLDSTSAGSSAQLVGSMNPRSLTRKPVIVAVNGPAATGGLWFVLLGDFAVASDRAKFADTHARVGIMPMGAHIGLLERAVGLPRAKEMLLTGNWIDADTALRYGLVNHVVPHEQLLPFVRGLASDIASYDSAAACKIKEIANAGSGLTLGDCDDLEKREFRAWFEQISPEKVSLGRQNVIERGRAQTR